MELADKETVRQTLPLPYVFHELGHPLDSDGRCLCPWHDDHNPSLRTWVDDVGVPRWGCFPCGAKGDVFDLLQRLEGVGFTASVARARQLLEEMPPLWEGAGMDRRREFDAESSAEEVSAGITRAMQNYGWVCVATGVVDRGAPEEYRVAADIWLTGQWHVGLDAEGNTVIPHYSYVRRLTGVKFRALGRGDRWAAPGSAFEHLYGGWRDRRHRTLLVCEGESDAWWASLQDPPADVLALPSGASAFLPHFTFLEADRWVLAFDGDEPGRNATEVWRSALGGRDVRVIVPPEGQDLRSWRPDLIDLLATI